MQQPHKVLDMSAQVIKHMVEQQALRAVMHAVVRGIYSRALQNICAAMSRPAITPW